MCIFVSIFFDTLVPHAARFKKECLNVAFDFRFALGHFKIPLRPRCNIVVGGKSALAKRQDSATGQSKLVSSRTPTGVARSRSHPRSNLASACDVTDFASPEFGTPTVSVMNPSHDRPAEHERCHRQSTTARRTRRTLPGRDTTSPPSAIGATSLRNHGVGRYQYQPRRVA